MRLGSFELTVLNAGEFLYDGGAMFGVVPRVIWEKLTPPDELNRIKLALNLLLIRGPDANVLVDAGFGTRLGRRDRKIFGHDTSGNVLTALGCEGLSPEDIDVVVLTHLHIDHAAGAVVETANGLAPAFPRARHIVHELEWEAALSPNAMSAAAYRRDDFMPLDEAGLVERVGDLHKVADGVSTIRTGGHTTGHLMVLVDSGEGTVVYPADLIPTRHHFKRPYVPAVDLFPLEVVDRKTELLREASRGDWIVILDHDTEGAVGRVSEPEADVFVFEGVEGADASAASIADSEGDERA